jgi:hypothetical protein
MPVNALKTLFSLLIAAPDLASMVRRPEWGKVVWKLLSLYMVLFFRKYNRIWGFVNVRGTMNC